MSLSMDIVIKKDNTEEVKRMLEQQARVALEAVGLLGEGYAKRLCPVDTGRLRNSITHTADDDTAYIGTNVEYAAYVELGTSKTKAQPYLKPAVQNHTQEYKLVFETYLKSQG